ncbi:CHAT domain-containing protein [Streptomyces sp. NPDC002838]|uniref:CHAT domain-containing protein n=1 Tax=Streptomyces sp. NPDC002838 TaxID=3154436 RepID=UPI003333E4B9
MPTVLELQICQLHPGEYEVRVVKAAAGGEPRATLKLNVDDLLAQRPVLEEKVVFSATATRRLVPPNEQAVQRVGRQLFDALFGGPVSVTYRESLRVAKERQESLQIVLRLDDSPELTLLPWEALFDPQADSYVCRQEPMVRHLEASHTPNPLPVQPPLRILVVIASPNDLPKLDTNSECGHLKEALTEQVEAGRVELDWLPDATWASLHTRLLHGPWHILHFIGHGDYDILSEEGRIVLVGASRIADKVGASRLADLIGDAKPVPRLIVLNTCASAQGGVRDKFSSVGASLVRRGISAVAAMQFSVSDQASVCFAQGLYNALARGRRVDDAVRSGRISMLGVNQSSLEWITPVLYVRGEANLLFNLTAQPQPPGGAQHNARLRRVYTKASEELRIGHLGKAIELLDDLLLFDPDNSDAIKLRDQAARQEQLIKIYDRAAEAEESEDWSAAIDCYEQIMQGDPDYRDTASRRDFCRDRQHIAHLQEELRSHASEGRWQAVLEVSEAVDQLDPAAADPDGLVTRARQEVAKEQRTAYLESLYARARAAERSEDWSAAIDCYEQIMQGDPDYRDTASRRYRCRDRQHIAHLQEKLRSHASEGQWQTVLKVSEELDQLVPGAADRDGLVTRARQEVAKEQRTAYLESLYARARAAERSEDWSAAIGCYEQIMQGDPDYRDTVTRRDFCRDRQHIARSTSSGRDSSLIFVINTLGIAAPCGAIAWGSSGQSLAVDIWADARIRVYDMSGVERLNIKTGKKGAPYIAAFSPDGTRLVSKSRKGATIWNAYTGEKLLHVPAGNEVAAAAFKPDGTCLATGSYDLACIWDAETAEKIFWAEQRSVQAVAFSPDGNRLIVADQRGLHVWQVDTGLKIFEDRRGFLKSVAYSPDGKRAAAGSSTDSKAYLWNPGQVHELAHDAPVTSVAFSPDGTQLATGSEDGIVRNWDATNARMICKILHDGPVLSLAFSPDGTRLATGTRRAVTVWTFRYI